MNDTEELWEQMHPSNFAPAPPADMNAVTLAGRLAVRAELKTFDSGTAYVRMLITIRTSEPRRRVDVVPVTIWAGLDCPGSLEELAELEPGARVTIAGSVQRRFWEAPDGRRSRLEIVAHSWEIK